MLSRLFRMNNALEKKPEEAVIFIHIPKCAGTTLTEGVIKKIYPRRQRLLFYDGDTRALMSLLQEMPVRRKEQLRCIAGHFAFGIHQFLPQRARYITLLREPVERVVSHFYFARRTRRHYLHEQVREGAISLKDYVKKLEKLKWTTDRPGFSLESATAPGSGTARNRCWIRQKKTCKSILPRQEFPSVLMNFYVSCSSAWDGV